MSYSAIFEYNPLYITMHAEVFFERHQDENYQLLYNLCIVRTYNIGFRVPFSLFTQFMLSKKSTYKMPKFNTGDSRALQLLHYKISLTVNNISESAHKLMKFA
jgi:hypothetical protein